MSTVTLPLAAVRERVQLCKMLAKEMPHVYFSLGRFDVLLLREAKV